MFKHEKHLIREVKVEKSNSSYANIMQEQLGGANGELTAALTYFIYLIYYWSLTKHYTKYI